VITTALAIITARVAVLIIMALNDLFVNGNPVKGTGAAIMAADLA